MFAIVRIDKLIKDPLEQIAVQSVLSDLKEARSEAERLNGLVDQSKTVYLVRATRYYPRGRSGVKPEAES